MISSSVSCTTRSDSESSAEVAKSNEYQFCEITSSGPVNVIVSFSCSRAYTHLRLTEECVALLKGLAPKRFAVSDHPRLGCHSRPPRVVVSPPQKRNARLEHSPPVVKSLFNQNIFALEGVQGRTEKSHDTINTSILLTKRVATHNKTCDTQRDTSQTNTNRAMTQSMAQTAPVWHSHRGN
jgi:hypothetical protein